MSSTPTAPESTGSRPFRARGAAARARADRSPEVVLEGPAGTGKTRAALEKLHWCACKYPGMRGLIVRKTRESLTDSALVTFEEKVLPAGSPLAAGASRATRRSYRYPNGSEVVVAGLVANHRDMRAKVMSTEYDLIVAVEATELAEHDWEQLTTRLRNGRMPYQQILGECNSDAPTHWLHQRCDRGQAKVYFSQHSDNPTLTPEYLDRLSRLTGVRRARLYEGRRAAAEGTVYAFDRAVHLVEPFPIPERWPRVRVIDFGYTNPFVCQWWSLDGNGRLFLYREWYRSRWTVPQHAERIKALSAGEKYEATVADHDADNRATLHQHGIPTWPAAKAVTVGIQAVEDRLAVQPDGRPRLFVMRGCLVEADPELLEAKKPVCTEQEFDGYVWPRGADGTSRLRNNPWRWTITAWTRCGTRSCSRTRGAGGRVVPEVCPAPSAGASTAGGRSAAIQGEGTEVAGSIILEPKGAPAPIEAPSRVIPDTTYGPHRLQIWQHGRLCPPAPSCPTAGDSARQPALVIYRRLIINWSGLTLNPPSSMAHSDVRRGGSSHG